MDRCESNIWLLTRRCAMLESHPNLHTSLMNVLCTSFHWTWSWAGLKISPKFRNEMWNYHNTNTIYVFFALLLLLLLLMILLLLMLILLLLSLSSLLVLCCFQFLSTKSLVAEIVPRRNSTSFHFLVVFLERQGIFRKWNEHENEHFNIHNVVETEKRLL